MKERERKHVDGETMTDVVDTYEVHHLAVRDNAQGIDAQDMSM